MFDFLHNHFSETFGASFQHWKDASALFSLDWNRLFYWILVLVILLSIHIHQSHKKSRLIQWVSDNLLKASISIWIIGFCTYLVGFYSHALHWLSVIPRAFMSAFKMFAMSYDITHVSKALQEDALYTSIFMLVHLAAVFITFVFIFKIIGYKLQSTLKIIRHCKRDANDKVVHLFWGVSEASLLLAASIRMDQEHHSDTIIFIDIDEEECKDCFNRKATLNRITNIITISDSEIERLDAIDALVDHCYNGPAFLSELMDNDVFKSLRLKRIGDIVMQSRQLNCYFLSNDETQNIIGALNLEKDWRIQTKLARNQQLTAYIHARQDANNEVFDHYSQYSEDEKRIKFKLIDSAYLSVQLLKQREETLPVNCVRIDNTGLVLSPFTALIVGFGSTGQEAFKFLYEFAAFVGSDYQKSPFKCYAIDENMDQIAGLVNAKLPTIIKDGELILTQTKIDTPDLWNQIQMIINELNYVVIALNNDTLGLSFAVNLFKYALLYRSNNQPMKIVLRCYDSNNEKRMQNVTDNLNKSILGEHGQDIELLLFGKEKEIYTCSTIVADELLNKAKKYHYTYQLSAEDNPQKIADDADKQWEMNFDNKAIAQLMKDKALSRYHAIYEINRCISQNISNVLHSTTKMRLMGLNTHEYTEQLARYYQYVNSREMKTLTYTDEQCSNRDKQLFYNMAFVEHERWIAAHKLMGYIWAEQKDLSRRLHPSMCPFEQLTEETQSYDYNVVDTTIKLAFQNMKKKL